jgi:hypothetical protein
MIWSNEGAALCFGRIARVPSYAEGVDGGALEAGSDVGVHRSGDADVGVAKEFPDDDAFDAPFQGGLRAGSGGRGPQWRGSGCDVAPWGGRVTSRRLGRSCGGAIGVRVGGGLVRLAA